MKKTMRKALLIVGILLIITFAFAIGYDYCLVKTRMFAVPLGLSFTIIMSAILLLLPGISCVVAAYIMRKKESI